MTRTITPSRTASRTRTVTATRTPSRTGTATVVAPPTVTRTPTRTRTITPTRTITHTRTATPVPQRVGWTTQGLTATLADGQTTTLDATLIVRRDVDAPAFHVFSRYSAVTIDPASLPARLVAGQSYTIRLNVTMAGTVQTYATINLLDETGRTVMDYQHVRLIPA
jgi:hypothetical protein